MGDIVKLLREIAQGFMPIPFFRMLFYGIIFSAIMTFIIGWTQGVFVPSAAFPYITNPAHSFWTPVVFVSFSFLFAFAGYLSSMQMKEDILSPIRRKLVGYWEVKAQTWTIEKDMIRQESVTTTCTIGIEDVGRKLIMHFKIKDSDIFTNQSIDITSVMIAFQGEPNKLIYFHDHELRLKEPIGSGAAQIVALRFPFLAVLNIISKNDAVDEMTGVWYDVDNSVLNLARRMPALKGLDQLVDSVDKGSITFKGVLSFSRIERPAGEN